MRVSLRHFAGEAQRTSADKDLGAPTANTHEVELLMTKGHTR